MIFGFGKRQDDEFEDEEEEEIDYVLFNGPLNGTEVNLKANARLAEAALIPAKEMVTDALSRRAERLRLEPKGKAGIVTLSVDGQAYSGGKMPVQQAVAVTQMLKLFAGLDIKERKKPQSGGIKAQFEEIPYELTVSVTPTTEGPERLIVSARNLKVKMDTPDDLGFTPALKDKIREFTGAKQGIVLVCGGAFSGVTTTTYVVLRTVDAYLYNIYSLADTGARELRGVTSYEKVAGETLPQSLQRIKRMEAEIIFVDPLKDAETAKTYAEWADQFAFIGEIAAKDPAGAILQMQQWIGPAATAEHLKAVISPKLIRTLCATCREAYKPNPKLVAKMGLPPETTLLYRPPAPFEPEKPGDPEPPPCENCGDVAYSGRAGMYEIVWMSDEMKKLVASGKATPDAIKAQARADKMQSFAQEGMRLVAQGRTSLEELQRVFKGPG